MRSISAVFAAVALSICSTGAPPEAADTSGRSGDDGGESSRSPSAEVSGSPSDLVSFQAIDGMERSVYRQRYPWKFDGSEWPGAAPLREVVATPPGYRRVDVGEGEFGAFLRHLPVRLDRTTVRSHTGRPLASPAAAVFSMPLPDGDLQQCADSLIRLHAEYLWRRGERSRIGYHFTSGDLSTWSDWRDGVRYRIDGSEVVTQPGPRRGGARESFRAYLRHLFRYAGTMSLRHDARRVATEEPTRPGDFFLQPGSPGHVVVVLDAAAPTESGPRLALLGQGFMPAQEFHLIEGGSDSTVGGVWFELPEAGELLRTPSWQPFRRDQRWRFEESASPSEDRSKVQD